MPENLYNLLPPETDDYKTERLRWECQKCEPKVIVDNAGMDYHAYSVHGMTSYSINTKVISRRFP